jgi:hypothetical protein
MGPDVREVGGSGMRVMVANAPLVYREAISIALKELRPRLEVYRTKPEALDAVGILK